MNDRVSVIIPSYNHSKFIQKTLDSILEESYQNKEIVIIDDGSKDNSVEMISNWIVQHDKEIDVIFKHRENRGVCATLNELKELATGQYLVVIASDDFLCNDGIKKRMDVIKNNPDKMVVFGDAHVVDKNDRIIYESSIADLYHGDKESLKKNEGILQAALYNPVFSGPLMLMNKDVYKIIGDYPKELAVEDWFFWQRISIYDLVIFTDEIVSCYRRHENNTTAYCRTPLKIERAVYKTCKMNVSLIKQKDIRKKFWMHVLKMQLIYYYHKVRYGKKNY